MGLLGMRLRMKGVPELIRTLREIDKKVAKKALRDGVQESTKPILKDAKAKVRVDTKLLKKSLGRKVKSYKGGEVIAGIVGVRKGTKGKKGNRTRTDKFRVQVGTDAKGKAIYMDPIKYAHLVEFGTRPHSVGSGDMLKRKGRKAGQVQRGGKHPGSKPYPFMRPALQKNKGGSKVAIRRAITDAIKAQRK